jgi:hypothetical protein
MAINLKFKPSLSPDVVKYNLYYKPHAADGYIHIELNSISQLAGLDGTYDLGVAAEDDAGNISPLLTQGLANLTLDFVAPSPPTEASIYYN